MFYDNLYGFEINNLQCLLHEATRALNQPITLSWIPKMISTDIYL